ncbi:MAG: hypothetical protein QXP60_05155 [Nitrososphaerota archaeon]
MTRKICFSLRHNRILLYPLYFIFSIIAILLIHLFLENILLPIIYIAIFIAFLKDVLDEISIFKNNKPIGYEWFEHSTISISLLIALIIFYLTSIVNILISILLTIDISWDIWQDIRTHRKINK